jgi:hypothetical protein
MPLASSVIYHVEDFHSPLTPEELHFIEEHNHRNDDALLATIGSNSATDTKGVVVTRTSYNKLLSACIDGSLDDNVVDANSWRVQEQHSDILCCWVQFTAWLALENKTILSIVQ